MDKSEQIEHLIANLGEPKTSIRHETQQELIKLGKSVVEPLVGTLRTGSAYQRAHAAIILGQMRDIRALAPLLAMRQHDNVFIRIDSARALGCLDSAHAAAALVDWLYVENNVLVQTAIVQMMAKLPAWAVFDVLIKTLTRTPSPSLRFCIIRVLGEMGDPRAIDAIFTYLEDNDPHVQREALIALDKLGVRHAKKWIL